MRINDNKENVLHWLCYERNVSREILTGLFILRRCKFVLCLPWTRCKEQHSAIAQEALRRAKFKFPGRQKIVCGTTWGFTPHKKEDYIKWRQEGRLIPDGVTCKLLSNHGPLSKRVGIHRVFENAGRICKIPVHAE